MRTPLSPTDKGSRFANAFGLFMLEIVTGNGLCDAPSRKVLFQMGKNLRANDVRPLLFLLVK